MAFQRAELQAMDEAMVTDFIEQWHLAMKDDHCRYLDKARLPERERTLLATMAARPALRSLASTPLLCAMLCALHLTELGELPRDRIQLYNRCVDMLLRRDERRDVDVSSYEVTLRPETIRWLLARLAYWMLEHDLAVVKRGDAERVIGKDGLDGVRLVRFLSERSGILRQQSIDEFDFIHRTFQEFLAAQQIVEEHEVRKVVRQYGLRSDWRETICLIAGYARPDDQARLLEELLKLAQQHHREQARRIHLLAWEFGELLDEPSFAATEWLQQHVSALVVGRVAKSLDLRDTQVSDLAPLGHLTNLKSLDLASFHCETS
jgi:predicted NACHT family NTPase